MRIPVMRGVIERRILANYRIDAGVMAGWLPAPFRPLLVGGFAIAGICLIRLKQVRPRFVPWTWGISSENAAHRIAVEWDEAGQTRSGVYIPRRDTSSWLNHWVGGTLFPGLHHHARFRVKESAEHFSIDLTTDFGARNVCLAGYVTDNLPETSIFPSLAAASEFFALGSVGYSATLGQHYDGLELRCETWKMQPLAIERIESSFFSHEVQFPCGSVEFDCALLMRGIEHTWHAQPDLCCAAK